jgi:hypothetical protein
MLTTLLYLITISLVRITQVKMPAYKISALEVVNAYNFFVYLQNEHINTSE